MDFAKAFDKVKKQFLIGGQYAPDPLQKSMHYLLAFSTLFLEYIL
jgi:hypothetical protein